MNDGVVSKAVAAVALVAITGATRMSAQEHPITFSAHAIPSGTTVNPGGKLTATVSASIPGGWHLYSVTQPAGGPVATSFAVAPRSRFRIAGALGAPKPNLTPDPNFGIITEWYADSAAFRVPVVVSSSATRGTDTVQILVTYQTCTDRYCLPPTEDTLAWGITIAGAPIVAASAPGVAPSSVGLADTASAAPAALGASATAVSGFSSPVSRRQSTNSLFLFLWLAASMGALALLTPCVFPMVPITVSYFSQRADVTRASAVGSAMLYAGGIVGAFSGLGLGAALIFGVGGLNRFAADPWLNIGIAVVFAGFALSLFGVVHIALPHALVNWLDRQARGNRFGRAGTTVLMGATFAVTTLTCTAPFVGTLLVSAAQGDWRWPAMGLVMFSSVLALPFFLLALAPRALARLPRSGTWMQTMKGTLAFIELAAATKFLSNADLVQGWGVFTRQTVLVIWVVLALLLSLFLLGLRPSLMVGAGVRTSVKRHLLPACASMGMAVWLASGLFGARLGEMESFLPPAGAGGSGVSGADELSWLLNDYDGAIAQAKRERRLVLIDFTGYTCTNCRWMEANMFPRPAVRRELDRLVRVRLFTDGQGSQFVQQQRFELERFKTVALPLYAVVDSLGATRATFLGMTRDTDEFRQFLIDAMTPTSRLPDAPR